MKIDPLTGLPIIEVGNINPMTGLLIIPFLSHGVVNMPPEVISAPQIRQSASRILSVSAGSYSGDPTPSISGYWNESGYGSTIGYGDYSPRGSGPVYFYETATNSAGSANATSNLMMQADSINSGPDASSSGSGDCICSWGWSGGAAGVNQIHIQLFDESLGQMLVDFFTSSGTDTSTEATVGNGGDSAHFIITPLGDATTSYDNISFNSNSFQISLE